MERIEIVKKGILSLKNEKSILDNTIKNIEEWMTKEDYSDYLPYVNFLIDNEKWTILLDSFWRMMPFGTGGRRGAVGAGPNRINPYTISLSVQGHCEYLKNEVDFNGELSVVVAHDVRQFFDLRNQYPGVKGILHELTSLDMARYCALTYAANGIKAYVTGNLLDSENSKKCTDRYLSTPELSFLIREFKCVGGLNVSASHNHPDDNGGKFYNRYGGQEIPPDDEKLLKIVEKIKKVNTMDYKEAVEKGLIEYVSKESHKKYIDTNIALSQTESRSAKLAFSPLSGTGMTTVYESFLKLGYDVRLVESQSSFDGSFKAVKYRIANPEVPDSMELLEKTAAEHDCDIGFSTDPDADRLGIIARDTDGSYKFINGNEIGVLLIQSAVSSLIKNNKLSSDGIFVNTMVTSSLQRTIARNNGLKVIGNLMVGFKYIGDVLRNLEDTGRFPPVEIEGIETVYGKTTDYVFGCEESHGYLMTEAVRDKDACGAAVHLAGLASDLKDQKKSVTTYLRDIYRVYGYNRNVLRSLVMEGIDGLKKIGIIQDMLRKNPPKDISGMKVLKFIDNHIVGGPLKSSTDEASRNVLLFELDGGNDIVIRLVVRPSGTEPKTKIYVEVPSTKKLGGTLDGVSKEDLESISDSELNQIIKDTDDRALKIGNEFIKYCLGSDVLGDSYPVVPDESLLVSDLVTVDNKIELCTSIMPQLAKRIEENKEVEQWLNSQLKKFGEDAIGLVKDAAVAWIDKNINNNKEAANKLFK
ncbi:MAG: phospho-sugar mutase [Deltaproteobacteria bacterium]|nr:phospho-sugar mutase [Deltaproteobacteria bacterium]